MSYPIPDHAEKMILAETVFNFYALACAGANLSYLISDHAEKLILAETVFNFSMHWLVPEPSQKYELSHPRPAEKLIVAETVFKFYALACAGAYSKV